MNEHYAQPDTTKLNIVLVVKTKLNKNHTPFTIRHLQHGRQLTKIQKKTT